MMAFGLGLLGLVLYNHSHLSAMPMLHPQRGHGHRYSMRTALQVDSVGHVGSANRTCRLLQHAYVIAGDLQYAQTVTQ